VKILTSSIGSCRQKSIDIPECVCICGVSISSYSQFGIN